MTNLLDLYLIAEENDIPVESFALPETESMSLQDGDCCYIGIDPFQLTTTADEKVKLAHELGHCLYGGFYNRYNPLDTIEKHERGADKWAVKKLIPKDELEEAFEAGCVEAWELAERFNVTEDYVRLAAKLYGFTD